MADSRKQFIDDVNKMFPLPAITDIQVAKILCLHRQTIYRWRLDGKGPLFVRIGKKNICMKEEFFNWFFSFYSNDASIKVKEKEV